MQQFGISALTLAILLGMFVGNTASPAITLRGGTGIDYAKSQLLRAGIVLYGLRVDFQQIAAIGWSGILADTTIVSSTFVLAVLVGTRVFKLDRQTSMLIGTGSAICGAAAIVAAEPIMRAQAHKVSVAIATVVVFGTLSMFAYPLLYPHLGMTEQAYGVFAGSTIHEVAQVVAAGRSVSETAATTAVVTKMLRVMMLAPFLLWLTRINPPKHRQPNKGTSIPVPWFALLFVATCAIHSLGILPTWLINILVDADTLLLSMAMAALGIRTHAGALRLAGIKPLMLGAVLSVFLLVGGYGINRGYAYLLG